MAMHRILRAGITQADPELHLTLETIR
jgi:hypothetical protein